MSDYLYMIRAFRNSSPLSICTHGLSVAVWCPYRAATVQRVKQPL